MTTTLRESKMNPNNIELREKSLFESLRKVKKNNQMRKISLTKMLMAPSEVPVSLENYININRVSCRMNLKKIKRAS